MAAGKIDEIRKDMDEALMGFEEKRTKMSSAAIRFTDIYDDYIYGSIRDASLLKERMKAMVAKGSDHEL